jgi:hypothetical protein
MAGCLDFVEPDLPELGAPAVAQISVVVSDSGRLAVQAEIAPGLDASGLRRTLINDDVRAAGFSIVPLETTDAGATRYASTVTVARDLVASTIEIVAPSISHTSVSPTARWAGLQRLDPDTVELESDGSLRLHAIERPDATVGAPPDTRQWFLTLIGDDNNFRLGSNGAPPETLLVPAHWIPEAAQSVVVRLIYQQSAQLNADTPYIGLITLDLRVHWTVILRDREDP